MASRHTFFSLFSVVFGFCLRLSLFSLSMIFDVSYWWDMNEKHPCRLIEAYFCVFISFRWKLLNLVALIHSQKFHGFNVFVHVCWFIGVKLFKKPVADKKLIESRKFLLKTSFFSGCHTFLAQFFCMLFLLFFCILGSHKELTGP